MRAKCGWGIKLECYQITWGRQESSGPSMEGGHKQNLHSDPTVVGTLERQ